MHKVLQPLFYAREDTRSPFRYALWSMLVNAVLALGLYPLIGFIAAAVATTLSSWVMVVQLWYGSRAMGPEAHFDQRLKSHLPRICLAAAIMGACLWLAMLALAPALEASGWRYPALALLVVLGLVSYFGSGALIGAFRIADLKAAMRRRR
jgi:putative peptidoglycan lipid II flippase